MCARALSALTLIPVSAQPPIEPTFVAMMGKADSYGEKPAHVRAFVFFIVIHD